MTMARRHAAQPAESEVGHHNLPSCGAAAAAMACECEALLWCAKKATFSDYRSCSVFYDPKFRGFCMYL